MDIPAKVKPRGERSTSSKSRAKCSCLIYLAFGDVFLWEQYARHWKPEGTSFVYHKNVLLTYNTLIEIQFNKKLSWEDVSIEQHEKNGQYQNDLLHFYKGF